MMWVVTWVSQKEMESGEVVTAIEGDEVIIQHLEMTIW